MARFEVCMECSPDSAFDMWEFMGERGMVKSETVIPHGNHKAVVIEHRPWRPEDHDLFDSLYNIRKL